jgi:hypothetical protein
MSDYFVPVTGVSMLVASWIASRERSEAGGSESAHTFLVFFTARRRDYTRRGWIAINLARLLLVVTLILIVIEPLQ